MDTHLLIDEKGQTNQSNIYGLKYKVCEVSTEGAPKNPNEYKPPYLTNRQDETFMCSMYTRAKECDSCPTKRLNLRTKKLIYGN